MMSLLKEFNPPCSCSIVWIILSELEMFNFHCNISTYLLSKLIEVSQWFINKILKRNKKSCRVSKKSFFFFLKQQNCVYLFLKGIIFVLSLCQFQVVKFLVESWMVVAPKPQETEMIAGTGNAGKVRKRRDEGRIRKEIEDDLQMMVPQVNEEKTACDMKYVYVVRVLCFNFNITFLKVSLY